MPASSVNPVRPKVLLIVYDPTMPTEGGRKLSQVFGWNDPTRLVNQYISDLSEASYGYCNYEIVDRMNVNAFPVKADGFAYTAASYGTVWRSRRGFHQPDWADYRRIVSDFGIVQRVARGEIDEVWLFAFPYAGFYESRMAGPGAFWCNAPPLEGFEHSGRRFVIMGFNFERGVGEMLESFGHRAESILAHVYRNHRGQANLWERFCRYDKSHPGRAEVGNVHFAPNSARDYDWGNRAKVLSRADSWYNYPDLSHPPRYVTSSEWGGGDIRAHHLWWLKHFPHVEGATGGIANNWWAYVINPNLVV